MNDNSNRILILALGNDIMGDDAAGLIAARELKKELGRAVDIFEVSSAGFSLIDILEGYRKVLILDSIPSGNDSNGLIIELKKENLSEQNLFSPHYVDIQGLMELAKKLKIQFPHEIKILAIEIKEKGVIREGLSEEIKKKIPQFIQKASRVIKNWIGEEYFWESQDELS